jgi:hypothetical protein
MKLSDFILLDEEEKKQAVLHEGVLISKRAVPSFFIFLFQVHNFYVEACFNADSKDIEEFRMFGQTSLLQPYLDNISLDDLWN